MPQAPSTRWCPTPEQLMILEEMYRSGIRTPNACHIQQITSHLAYYGKIEGKNVFYWFQNHKARDRQKMRRRISRHQLQILQHQHQINGHTHHLSNPTLLLPQHQLTNYNDYSHQFLHQQENYRELEIPAGMNLLYKQEKCTDRQGESSGIKSPSSSSNVSPFWKPLKTLDLFPTKSTGLIREEYCTMISKSSSSCSTSPVN